MVGDVCVCMCICLSLGLLSCIMSSMDHSIMLWGIVSERIGFALYTLNHLQTFGILTPKEKKKIVAQSHYIEKNKKKRKRKKLPLTQLNVPIED